MTAEGWSPAAATVPGDWVVSTVAEVAADEAYSCVGGPFGSDLTTKDYVACGVPVIRGTNLTGRSRWLVEEGFVYVSQNKADELSRNLARPGDLVFTQRGTLGQVARIRLDAQFERFVLSQSQMKLTPRAASADPDFLYHYFASPVALRMIERATTATGIPHINLGILKSLSVLLPPLGEQRKISAILSSVDDAIEATQAVIDQLQVVKRAMMAELLTRGLPGRHTKFKMTEIGEVPDSWRVLRLADVLQGIDSGWSPQCESRPAAETEWGVLKVSAVTSGTFVQQEQKALPLHLAPRPEAEVKRGDVLLARANGVLELVGKTVLVRETRPRLMLSDKLLRLRPVESELDASFLSIVMGTEAVRGRLLSTTGGSHMRNVSQASLRVLLLPLPAMDEQTQIAETLDTADERLATEKTTLGGLRALKSALMSVLLTGELRVTPGPEPA